MSNSGTDEFAGKVALITGGARNIGRALALELAAAGAAVCVNSHGSAAELDEIVATIKSKGGSAMRQVGDVTDAAAARQMVKSTVEAFGRIDILVNGAVVHVVKPFLEITPEEWRKTIAVVLDGAFHCTQACLPEMIKAGGGSIINMGGAAGHLPLWRRAPTSAAKAGLAGLTRALAQEFAEHNINVNCVAPGPVNTVRSTPLTFDMKQIPLGRFAEISEVTALIKLLCSANGRYITGQTIHVNGGFFMNN
jgi:3-oxoacyl-[acyl-carrier protein] reductase